MSFSFVQLSVTGEGPFTFTSLSSAFKVSNNGEVAFFPTKAGEYYALIEVKSSKGGSTLISFRVLVNDPETKPALAVLPEIPCALGESIHYTVHANVIPGIIVNYFAETSDFRIDPVSGVIDFTPTVAGSHSYRIIAMNQYGEYADSYLKMECS